MRNITLTFDDGTTHQYNNVPDDVTPKQINDRALKEFKGARVTNIDGGKQSKPTATEQQPPKDRGVGEELIRQAGLTARDVIEGGASTLGLVSDPMGVVLNKITGLNTNQRLADTGSHIADAIGLPIPENASERVINDTAKLLVGTGGMVKGASSLASKVASPIAKASLNLIGSNAGMQAASSIGSGVAGGVAKENDAGFAGQLLASLAGGVATPLAAQGAKSIAGSIGNMVNNRINPNALNAQAIQSMKESGITLDQLPANIQQSITDDVKNALKNGDNLSTDAMRRLVDYRTVGATPMRSSLTLNPADITRDRNLAKLSANSRDPAAQELSNLQRNNDLKLMDNLNNLGAETADDAITTGNKVIQALNIKDESSKKVIDAFYKQARATDGRSAILDPHAFTNRANDLLDEAMLGGKVPSDVVKNLNLIASGKTPLTVDVAEQYKTAIAGLQRSSTDPAERLALGKIRQALEETPLLDGQGQKAIDAFNLARNAHKNYMKIVDRTPALQAIRDGVEPDKFVQTYILGNGNKSNIADVKALKDALKGNDEAITSIRGQIVSHLKSKALNGKTDDVANFSPNSFDKALKDIGFYKLDMFFSKEDINMLKTIGRVGSYEKFQPTGSAVNNSNTAAAAFTAMLDRLASSPLIRKIPLASSLIANPAQDVQLAFGARNALNTSKALVTKPVKQLTNKVPIGALLYQGDSSGE